MSGGGTITVRRRRPYAAVPDDLLEDVRLRPTTRLIAAWAIGRPPGWLIQIGHMLRRLGISDEVWLRARRELIAAGYLVQRRDQASDGRICWATEFLDEPSPTSMPAKSRDGKSMPVKTVDISVPIPPDQKKHTPRASARNGAEEDVPVPRRMDSSSVRRLISRAQADDRAAIVAQVDAALTSASPPRDPRAYLARLVQASAEGTYVPSPATVAADASPTATTALRQQRMQIETELRGIERLQGMGGPSAAASLAQQIDALREQLVVIDDELQQHHKEHHKGGAA